MRTTAETLYIGRIGRGGAGLLGVGPGLLIRRLAGRFVERDDALACLRYVRAGAEVLQICRIGGGGAGLLGVGPGLLVGLLARLLIGRLLLRRLLRIRGLAASRREGSPGNDGNDRQFRKCDAARAPRPHGKALPANAASAPSATARTTSSPERTPLSSIRVTRPPTARAMAGSTSMGAGRASTWRPPWFDTTMPSTPSDTHLSASAG